MTTSMDTSTIERALQRLGDRLEYHCDVEILLVGGAAGMVTGVLPASRVTSDCDVIAATPDDAMLAVEIAGQQVAAELGLDPRWLNSDAQLRVDALPVDWESRQIIVGQFGRLLVRAISRPDLIAMKVLAGRDKDIDDLTAMRVRTDEIAFVRAYLGTLPKQGTPRDQIKAARLLLEAFEVHDDA